ncbi:hypothetical protein O181_001190 [Austropuccinia psidii MF-1]|uniref:Uncharacterized protein n=1 Tax=Austropuccinia psidii MF-1 TaxID=1389203 RepID=A0A9Q3BAI2_9BASI|nr:hypothetical protein [Austropuccinia psidii MF-1]
MLSKHEICDDVAFEGGLFISNKYPREVGTESHLPDLKNSTELFKKYQLALELSDNKIYLGNEGAVQILKSIISNNEKLEHSLDSGIHSTLIKVHLLLSNCYIKMNHLDKAQDIIDRVWKKGSPLTITYTHTLFGNLSDVYSLLQEKLCNSIQLKSLYKFYVSY